MHDLSHDLSTLLFILGYSSSTGNCDRCTILCHNFAGRIAPHGNAITIVNARDVVKCTRATHGIAARALAVQHALVRELYLSSHVLHVQSSLAQTQPDHRTRRGIRHA